MSWDALIEWGRGAAKDFGLFIGAITAGLAFTKTWWLPAWRRWRERRKAHAGVPGQLTELAAALDRVRRTGDETLDSTTMLHGMVRHQADSHGEAVFETDGAGLNVWVNAAYLRWTGLQLEQCLGWGWINAVSHVDRARVRDEWEDALAESRTFTSTYHLLDATGRAFEVTCKATPLRNRAGAVVKWMGNLALTSTTPNTLAPR